MDRKSIVIPAASRATIMETQSGCNQGRQRARVINAPANEPPTDVTESLFLSGSTDPATSTDWRSEVIASLAYFPVTIYNPLRPDWDETWQSEITFVPFREQVEWELGMLDSANIIAVYFAPKSMACTTLLELGLYAHTGKMVVACPKEFWRRGNVEIVCERYAIKMVEDLEDLIVEVKKRLSSETST